MIDKANKTDILNLSVRSADFLCQNTPLVCAVELNRSPDRRRTRGFLLEEKMDKKEYLKQYYRKKPWAKTQNWINSRCCDKNSKYYKKGIKNFLSLDDLKYLWKRDRAYQMKKPTIHRINNDGNYTLDNCKYLEFTEHFNVRPIKQLSKDGRLIKIWNSIGEAARCLSLDYSNILGVINKYQYKKTVGGFRWDR